ncbi:MAG: CopG family transcriptional regulator [Mycobacterium sp.]|nr:CopG family transcriptional regulator [Mycobacterium sp.]
MNEETWRLIVAESDAIEAAEADQTDGPLPDHVKVSRPNRADSRAVQVWLRNSEADALEAIAAQRDLPVSTVARAHLLGLIDDCSD